ncbi:MULTISPECIES: hypothetical protein [unclassified Haladaptatus]|uniref:hypothetical protein n=1 Tax=unclassified Haladaptatus TaxID=2622732 RepID=UPI002FCE37D5
MASDDPRLNKALSYFTTADDRWETFGEAFVGILGGLMLAVGAGFAAGIDAVTGFFTGLIDAFGLGGVTWINAITTAPAGFIGQAFDSAARSIDTGAFAELGPFLPWIATLVSIGVVSIVAWYLDRRDSDVPGLGIDLPFIGNDSDGEED